MTPIASTRVYWIDRRTTFFPKDKCLMDLKILFLEQFSIQVRLPWSETIDCWSMSDFKKVLTDRQSLLFSAYATHQ